MVPGHCQAPHFAARWPKGALSRSNRRGTTGPVAERIQPVEGPQGVSCAAGRRADRIELAILHEPHKLGYDVSFATLDEQPLGMQAQNMLSLRSPATSPLGSSMESFGRALSFSVLENDAVDASMRLIAGASHTRRLCRS